MNCPNCGKEIVPEQTVNTGEEGGYFESFEPGDLLTCSECGTQFEVPEDDPEEGNDPE